MRGHFLYLRFKTFPMTPKTPQCEVFWALLSNSKHSGVPEDSKSPTLEVLGFTPTLGQSGVATFSFYTLTGVLLVLVLFLANLMRKARNMLSPMHLKTTRLRATTFHMKGNVWLFYGQSYISSLIFMTSISLCILTISLSSG